MAVNDELFTLQADLADYPGNTEDDLQNRRLILRRVLEKVRDEGRQEGYADAIRDAADARILAMQAQDKAAKAAGAVRRTAEDERDETLIREASPDIYDSNGSLRSLGPASVRSGVADDGTVFKDG